MKSEPFITNKEHKLLLAAALTAFVFSIAGYIAYSIKADNERSEYFKRQEENKAQNKPVFAGPYCFPDKHPKFLFSIILLAGSIFLSLCFAKKYLFSFSFTAAAMTRYYFWFIDTQELFDTKLNAPEHINRFFYNAGGFDFAAFLLVSILLFWQISILFRILIKSLQRKFELP